jgi:hypothetical protein
MFSISGDGTPDLSAGLHIADGETYEIRYVDPGEAARWAAERGYLLCQDDIVTGLIAYSD